MGDCQASRPGEACAQFGFCRQTFINSSTLLLPLMVLQLGADGVKFIFNFKYLKLKTLVINNVFY